MAPTRLGNAEGTSHATEYYAAMAKKEARDWDRWPCQSTPEPQQRPHDPICAFQNGTWATMLVGRQGMSVKMNKRCQQLPLQLRGGQDVPNQRQTCTAPFEPFKNLTENVFFVYNLKKYSAGTNDNLKRQMVSHLIVS